MTPEGELAWRQDYNKALELFRRITSTFKESESKRYAAAQAAINTITQASLGLMISQTFLPESEQEVLLSTRNVKGVELTIVPVDLTVPPGRQLRVASRLASTLHVPIVVVHVLEPVSIPYNVRMAMGGIDTARRERAEEQLAAARARVLDLVADHSQIFVAVRRALADEGIDLVDYAAIPEHHEALRQRFLDEIFPVLTPLAVDPGHPFPYISTLSLSIAVGLRDPETGE